MRYYVGLIRKHRVVWWIAWCLSLSAARDLAGHWLYLFPQDSLVIDERRNGVQEIVKFKIASDDGVATGRERVRQSLREPHC